MPITIAPALFLPQRKKPLQLEGLFASYTYSGLNFRLSCRRVRRNHCWFPLPSEPYVRVSPHTAQAFISPVYDRTGFLTFKPTACSCVWQVGCNNTKLERLSLPPSTRGTRW